MLDLKGFAAAKISEEFAEADLGDARRTRRLQRIAERAMAAPNVGFPRMVADDSELEGLYRFFGCEEIEAEDVLEPHIQTTVRRMSQVDGPVLVVHDTTDLSFGGLERRRGLGRTNGNQQGFIAHVALAVVPGEERIPLGACGLIRISRTEDKVERTNYQAARDPQRESLRWGQLATRVDALSEQVSCIHVMDREADNYDLFDTFQRNHSRFVVRGSHDRALPTGDRLFSTIEEVRPQCFRDVEVSKRGPRKRERETTKFPPRSHRIASVAIAAKSVTLRRSDWAQAKSRELAVNLVRVWEPSPPNGEPPVSWLLYTSEPIDTDEQLFAIVDFYRSRWLIEEFFKALKTGCSIEKRQLEPYRALSVALAVFLPVAWRMLLIRAVSRKIPDAPATAIASDVQLQILQHKLKLEAPPQSAEAVALAIAKLGGHLKRNGAPGWITLGRGLESLLLMEMGWIAAMARRCDQS